MNILIYNAARISLLLLTILTACSKGGNAPINRIPQSPSPVAGIAYVSESGLDRDINLIQPDGSGRTALIRSQKVDSDPAFSPDGRTIAFRSRRDGSSDIYLAAADGTGTWLNLVKDRPDSFDDEFSPTWHPSGNSLAIFTDRFQPPMGNCSGQNGVHHIGFISLTDAPVRITHFDGLAGEQETLSWSPDGITLAFGSICSEANVRIFLWDMHTGEVRPITDDAYGAANPTFSPNGRYLAFSATRDGPTDIMIYDIEIGTIRNLTMSLSKDRHPTWSPDGEWIAFTSDEGGNDDIFKIRIDGTGRQNLTNSPGRDILPDWSPVDS